MLTDKELLDKFLQCKDGRAFEEIFHRYFVCFQNRALLYIKNEEDRKDFLQDLWFNIFKHIGQLKTDKDGSAAAYLNIMFTHDIYDFYKKREWTTVHLDDELLGKLQLCDKLGYNSVEDDVYCAEVEEQKAQVINALSETNRRIYNLYEKHRFSIQDIARYSSLSEGTIRNKISMIAAIINSRLKHLVN